MALKHSSLGSTIVAITGAGSGIGRATAIRLAALETRLVLVGRRLDPLEETAEACGGVDTLVVSTDLTDEEQVDALAARIRERFGKLDGLVNNAGISRPGSIQTMSKSDWDLLLAGNLSSVFLTTQRLLPLLENSDHASVVNVASTLGLTGLKGSVGYCAAKAGVVNFTRAVALDVADAGIRCNAVCPGVIDTPMIRDARDDEMPVEDRVGHLGSLHPMGRIGTPDEVAAAIVSLLDPDSSFTTGAILNVDGGLLAGFRT